MHGKSGSFASQNSRFRTAKPKLPFFVGTFLTKRRKPPRSGVALSVETKKCANNLHTFLNNSSNAPFPAHCPAPLFSLKSL
ncbi:hypothetical protein CTM63_12020 [Prevotella intermedia]|nr:hypothetical protein CTM63_12020 [Prevotella intermedia]